MAAPPAQAAGALQGARAAAQALSSRLLARPLPREEYPPGARAALRPADSPTSNGGEGHAATPGPP
eukprot:2460436-Pyramimonas_sp.AAC.1